MRCAFTIIRLCSACRNIFVSFITGTAQLSIISFSTLPGPIDGSWSLSPQRITRAPVFTARRNDCISGVSTMLTSSRITASYESGCFSLNENVCTPFLYSEPRRRCIVFASSPVTCERRFAARPVGAARATLSFISSSIFIMVFTVVVFPVPGPPVSTMQPVETAVITAFFCSAASSVPPESASMRSSASMGESVCFCGICAISARRLAIYISASKSSRRKYTFSRSMISLFISSSPASERSARSASSSDIVSLYAASSLSSCPGI